MRLPRMTTRRWMIAVVIFAVTLLLVTRSFKYLRKAAHHRNYASQFAAGSDVERAEASFLQAYLDARGGSRGTPDLTQQQVSRLERVGEKRLRDRISQAWDNTRTYAANSAYHTRMACLYERTARCPWLAVPDDSWAVSPDPPAAK